MRNNMANEQTTGRGKSRRALNRAERKAGLARTLGYRPQYPRFWQNWQEDGAKVERFWKENPAMVERREHFFRVVTPYLEGFTSMLDYACGTCEDYPFFIDQGLAYTGADVTEAMMAKAREKFPEVDVEQDDVFNSKYADGQWPLVVANALLLHLPVKWVPKAIKELVRITRNRLVIRVSALLDDHEAETFVRWSNNFVVVRWSRRTFAELFKAVPHPTTIIYGDTEVTKDVVTVIIDKEELSNG